MTSPALTVLVTSANTTVYESTATSWTPLATGNLQLTAYNNTQYTLIHLSNNTETNPWQFHITLPFNFTQDSSSDQFFYFSSNDSIFYGVKFDNSKLAKLFIKHLRKINGITVTTGEPTTSAKSVSLKTRILNFFKRKPANATTTAAAEESSQESSRLKKFVREVNRANASAIKKLENFTIDQIITTTRNISKTRAVTNFFHGKRREAKAHKNRPKKKQQHYQPRQYSTSSSSSSSSSQSPPQKDINININIQTDHYQNNLSNNLIQNNKTINYFGTPGGYSDTHEARFSGGFGSAGRNPASQQKLAVDEGVKFTVRTNENDSLNMAIRGFNRKNLSSTEISFRPANDDSFLKQELDLRKSYMKLSDSESGGSESGW